MSLIKKLTKKTSQFKTLAEISQEIATNPDAKFPVSHIVEPKIKEKPLKLEKMI